MASMSAWTRDWEDRLIARKRREKCMVLADVSWPASRKINALPMTSSSVRPSEDFSRPFTLALTSSAEALIR